MDVLEGVPLGELLVRDASLVTFRPAMRAGDLLRARGPQDVYPVVDAAGKLVGIITSDDLRILGRSRTSSSS